MRAIFVEFLRKDVGLRFGTGRKIRGRNAVVEQKFVKRLHCFLGIAELALHEVVLETISETGFAVHFGNVDIPNGYRDGNIGILFIYNQGETTRIDACGHIRHGGKFDCNSLIVSLGHRRFAVFLRLFQRKHKIRSPARRIGGILLIGRF